MRKMLAQETTYGDPSCCKPIKLMAVFLSPLAVQQFLMRVRDSISTKNLSLKTERLDSDKKGLHPAKNPLRQTRTLGMFRLKLSEYCGRNAALES